MYVHTHPYQCARRVHTATGTGHAYVNECEFVHLPKYFGAHIGRGLALACAYHPKRDARRSLCAYIYLLFNDCRVLTEL